MKKEMLKLKNIEEKESILIKKIMKLKEDTEKELNKLYMSQFTKEQIKEFETVGILDTDGVEITKQTSYTDELVVFKINQNKDINKKSIEEIDTQYKEMRNNLEKEIEEINAMLSIVPENETEKNNVSIS